MKTISAFAPATLANFNVGYDVLGLALNAMGDTVHLTANGTKYNRITNIINGPNLPYETQKNCCSVVIEKMQQALQQFTGVDLVIEKGFQAGSGMGSSSASSAAAAYAYNQFMGNPFTTTELVQFAAEGERIACGTAHVDNVAPALLGGIVLAGGPEKSLLISLPVPPDLYAITLSPAIEIKTADARKIIKTIVPLNTCSQQVGLMGAFVASLYEQNLNWMAASLKDLLIEPARSVLIPKFETMKKVALEHKALAFGISGSGPAVFAIASEKKTAQHIQIALENVFKDTSMAVITSINKLSKNSGARIL